jgi:HEAT repeat protein
MKFFLIALNLFFINASLYSQEKALSLPKKALETIIKNLKQGDIEIKTYSIEILGQLGNKRVIPIIKEYLKSENKYIKISAAKSLWQLEDKSGLDILYEIVNDSPSQATINDPLVELKNIAQNKIREKAIETIVFMLGKDSRDFLIKIKNNDTYPVIRDVASRELAKLGSGEDLDVFISSLNSEDEETKYQAAQILSKICPSKISKITDSLKKEKIAKIKMFLIDAIACSKNKKDAMDEIIKLADDKNPTIRYKAINAMDGIDDKKILDKLQLIYSDTPDMNLKTLSMCLLAKYGKLQIKAEDLTDLPLELDLKKKVISASEYMDKTLAYNFLNKMLNDPDPYISLEAAKYIIKLNINGENKK